MLRDKISLCQAGIQYYAIYAAAHELYLRREYQRAMGMAEAALMMAGNNFPIASIYLNLVLCMICMNLKDDEHADAAFIYIHLLSIMAYFKGRSSGRCVNSIQMNIMRSSNLYIHSAEDG